MSHADFTSGTGMAAQHALRYRLSFYVAPTDADGKNTIRIPLLAVACWRLNDPAFDFDSSFVLPAFRPELGKLAALVQANPGHPGSLFAHADPVGSDDVNKDISDRRGRAVYALLTRQPPMWEDLYAKPIDGDTWGTRAVQWMLTTVVDGEGNPYYPGPVDGDYGPNTKSAVQRFQTDGGLAVDGDAGPNTRKVLFGAYMDVLCTPEGAEGDPPASPFRMAPADFLGEGADANGKMALQGCSRFNPVHLLTTSEMNGSDTDTRNDDNAPNRRVVMFLFRPGTPLRTSDWPCPRVGESASACKSQFWPDGDERRRNASELRKYEDTRDTMACRFYDRIARRSPCEGGVPLVVHLQLKVRVVVGGGKDAQPLADRPYRLTIQGLPGEDPAAIEGITDDTGLVHERVPATATGATLVVLHKDDDGKETELWAVDLDFGDLVDPQSVAGAQSRLTNLGLFPGNEDGTLDDQTKRAVRRFQALEDLPINWDDDGWTIDADTASKLKDRHGV